MATFDEFYRSLPEDSNKRGEFFEKVFIPWFLKTDPEWSTKVKQIWLWEEYPGRWGRDCGIDLVYEDRQGNHWAVQSKCVAPDREISKAEIDSFLSESNDSRIYGRLLIASTDGIGKNALQVLERQEKQIVCFLREHFQQSGVEFPSSPDELASGRRKDKRVPRPHQEEAIKNVVAGFKENDRGQLLMACGTGKTLTSLWIKEALNAHRTLVLLPSLSLLSQTLREWTATSRKEFNWICVCSDKSVVKQDKTVDDWIENVRGLGVPVSSDPEEIRQFLQGNEGGVIFSTYQSSVLIAEAQKDPGVPGFDIAFADEAHRCTGKVSSAFGCVLDDKQIRAKKRLFMTATPRILSPLIKKSAESENIDIASMDDEGLFGNVLHRLNFSEAINRELLTNYRVIVVGIDDPQIKLKIDNRPLISLDGEKEMDYETLVHHIVISKAIKEYDLQRLITFHSRIKSAKRFSEDHKIVVNWLPEESKSKKIVNTSFISGEMSSFERNIRIKKIQNITEEEVEILSNARCLSEGIDVPSLDGIAFIDPRSSQVDIIQAVGRAIRKNEEKSFGYIIIPVYLGDTINCEEEILISRFKDVWKIILALKSQDDSMRDVLDNLRIELGRRKELGSRNQALDRIIFDLPENVINSIGDSIKTILVTNTTEGWMETYGKLVEYVTENGDSRVPQSHQTLGGWVSNQRSTYKVGKLSRERINLLGGLNGWCWDYNESNWQNIFKELKEYVKENGNSRVPKSNKILREWMSGQRKNYKGGKLSKERIDLLETLSGWYWDSNELVWQDKFEELEKYVKENGNARVIKTYPSIGAWVVTQRVTYNRGELSKERINLLETLNGWSWDSNESVWQDKFEELKDYVRDNGNALVPLRYSSLGKWVISQRQNYKAGNLSKDRIDILEGLNGWSWDSNELVWQDKFEELKKYIEENGNAQVPKTHLSIQHWVNNQKQTYRRGKLSREHIDLLETLSGWCWDYNESNWQNIFKELKEYVKENGNSRVPKSNKILREWMSGQRKNYKGGKLSKERIDLLETLSGWYWDSNELVWQDKYEELKKYIEENGDSRLPQSHQTLGGWVSTQRCTYKVGKLSRERIDLLETLSGWYWDPNELVWQDKFEELEKYAKENGNARVPKSHQTLGIWVVHQRSTYNRGELSKERIDLLEGINGWIWDIFKSIWHDKFEELKDYVKENGDTRVPRTHQSLGVWVKDQRIAYKSGKLSKERIDLLEGINGWIWDIFKSIWHDKFEELKDYVKENGNTKIPRRYPSLGEWVSTQRSSYKVGKLSKDQIILLEGLNGWCWDLSKK